MADEQDQFQNAAKKQYRSASDLQTRALFAWITSDSGSPYLKRTACTDYNIVR